MHRRTLPERLSVWFSGTARCVLHPRQTLRRRKRLRRLRRNRTQAAQRRDALSDYGAWFENRFDLSESERDALRQQLATEPWSPRIAILMVTRGDDLEILQQTLESVFCQIYPYWELCLTVDVSTSPRAQALLRDFATRDARIRVITREHDTDVALALNAACEHCTGDYLGQLRQGDQLTEDALYRVWQFLKENRQTSIVYSDEDQIDERGRLHSPDFKPDWSPEFFLSRNYVGQFTVIAVNLVRRAGGFRCKMAGALEYDLLLRCLSQGPEPSTRIGHIPRILYHRWQADDARPGGEDRASKAWDAGLEALRDYAATLGERTFAVEYGKVRHSYHVSWLLPAPPPRVSLIIPTRDRHDLLAVCVDSILEKTDYSNYEILIVDNRSTCKATLALLEQYHRDPRIRVMPYDAPFNFSAICNWAVNRQQGSITGLVNNDVQVINAAWLTEMVSQCERPEIGCVGAKLRYGDDRIQHAGVILGLGGTAGHAHHREPAERAGYGARLSTVNNCAAVTAACLLVRKCVYQEVGGMDEIHLTTAYNDVDLCLKVMQAGYRNVFTPYAELYHYESQTRGLENTRKKKRRFASEAAFIQAKWGQLIANDPYYNPNLETTPPVKSFDLKLVP